MGSFHLYPPAFCFLLQAGRKRLQVSIKADELIADCMREQERLEADGTESIDAAAEPTARILSALARDCAHDEKEAQDSRTVRILSWSVVIL